MGRVGELSILEIRSVLAADGIPYSEEWCSPSVFIIQTQAPIECRSLMRRLGGCIKIGVVLHDDIGSQGPLPERLAAMILAKNQQPTGRITFGISRYTVSQKKSREHQARRAASQVKTLGLEVKKLLREYGASVRFVAPTEGEALTSVQTEKNGLCESNGCEILVLPNAAGNTSLGTTCAVQDFEEYSFRDWQRPEREMSVGLLPPKLARMMINLSLARANDTLLDPFCGFGTILSEALDLGVRNVIGGDLEKTMVRRAQTNIEWLKKHRALPGALLSLAAGDATQLTRAFAPRSIAAIVTEPTLGPVVMRSGAGARLPAILRDLEKIYSAFFREAHSVLKKQGRLVVVLPFWIQGEKRAYIPFLEKLLAQGFVSLLKHGSLPDFGNLSSRGSILIVRPGQHVGRELFIFQKTS